MKHRDCQISHLLTRPASLGLICSHQQQSQRQLRKLSVGIQGRAATIAAAAHLGVGRPCHHASRLLAPAHTSIKFDNGPIARQSIRFVIYDMYRVVQSYLINNKQYSSLLHCYLRANSSYSTDPFMDVNKLFLLSKFFSTSGIICGCISRIKDWRGRKDS